MAQIFTSTGKGPKRESNKIATTSNAIAFAKPPQSSKAIAFQPKVSPMKNDPSNAIAFAELQSEKVQRLCSVAFAHSPPSVSPRFKPANAKVALRSNPNATRHPDGKVTVTIDDDGVITGMENLTEPDTVTDDDGTTRIREHVEFADECEAASWQD